jgi:hypothetical protein
MCGNWDCVQAIPFLEIFVSNFRYCVFAVYTRAGGSVPQPYALVNNITLSWTKNLASDENHTRLLLRYSFGKVFPRCLPRNLTRQIPSAGCARRGRRPSRPCRKTLRSGVAATPSLALHSAWYVRRRFQ